MTIQTSYDHFSQIAPKYRGLRSTDLEPIEYICSQLGTVPEVNAVDVGCGAGRYDSLLFRYLGEGLRLVCADQNKAMLRELSEYLAEERIIRFRTVAAPADDLPLASNALDCVFTFNAVHHFPLSRFLQEARRVLRPGGVMFVYTRTRSQNARSVWGAHFPMFDEKEDRLYEVDEMAAEVLAVQGLSLEEARVFRFPRMSTVERLMEQAEHHHYSTLGLYTDEELRRAMPQFEDALYGIENKTGLVSWEDENTLFVIKKVARPAARPLTMSVAASN